MTTVLSEIRKKCQNKMKTNILRSISSPVWMPWPLLSRQDQFSKNLFMLTFHKNQQSENTYLISDQKISVEMCMLFFLAFVFVLEPKVLHSLLIRWGPENIFAKLNLLSCQCCFSSRVNIYQVYSYPSNIWKLQKKVKMRDNSLPYYVRRYKIDIPFN